MGLKPHETYQLKNRVEVTSFIYLSHFTIRLIYVNNGKILIKQIMYLIIQKIKNIITSPGKILHHILYDEKENTAHYTSSSKPQFINRSSFARVTHRRQVTLTFTLSIK